MSWAATEGGRTLILAVIFLIALASSARGVPNAEYFAVGSFAALLALLKPGGQSPGHP